MDLDSKVNERNKQIALEMSKFHLRMILDSHRPSGGQALGMRYSSIISDRELAIAQRFTKARGRFIENIKDPVPAQELGRSDPEDFNPSLRGKVIGPPMATACFTVEQFIAMGMVGVYDPPRPKQPKHSKG